MSTYVLYTNEGPTEFTVEGRSPRAALRELCAEAGFELVKQDGRYGTLADGRTVCALLRTPSRVRYPEHGTTRFLRSAR